MSIVHLDKRDNGSFRLRGELNFDSVADLWRAGHVAFANEQDIVIDLKQVKRSDSAGLALLIEWLREGKKAGKTVSYQNMPSQMLAIARASSLDQILPLSRS